MLAEPTYLSPHPPIRVAVVDDDVAFVHEFVAAIETAPDIELVNTAHTLAQAIRFLDGPAADVLLVDLGLPDGSGISAIRKAREYWPTCPIMVSTAFADELHVIQSIEAGASGYLLKDSAAQKLADDIRSLHAGGSPISPLIARQVLLRFRRSGDASPPLPPTDSVNAPPALSPREQEVLGLITKGFTYDEISNLLNISRNTVMTFVRRIYAKLEVKSKVEAIHEAQQRGLLGN